MACRFTYNGKEYDEDGLAKALREMPPAEAAKFIPGVKSVPSAPFVGKTEDWASLSMKRMIRYAAENGYDKIAWTGGEAQAARYDLSKQIDKLHVKRLPSKHGDAFQIDAVDHRGNSHNLSAANENALADSVGKEMAEKIVSNKENSQFYSGLDLKVGGEGMKGFYDQILPATVNKLVKKFGGKVGGAEVDSPQENPFQVQSGGGGHRVVGEGAPSTNFPTALSARQWISRNQPKETQPVHALDITDTLRDAAVNQGFPLFQQARGSVLFRGGRRPVLKLFAEANASTIIHEWGGHVFLEELMADAEHPAATDQLKTDAATVRDWLGIETHDDLNTGWKGERGKKARAAHEKFATGFEQYMREGIAPSKELASVFAKFKDWLLKLYQTIKGLGKPINDDIRGVFDRMLAAEPQRTVIAPERAAGKTLADIHEADAAEFAPHEADAAAARIDQERRRAYDEHPDEQREIEAAIAAAQPPGEAGPSGGGLPEVQPGGGPTGPQPASGGAGAEPGPQREGVAGARQEGTGVSEARPEPGNREESKSVPLAPSPAANLSIGGESFNVGRDGNVRVENLTSVEQFRKAIEESAERNPGGDGTTMGQMLDLADETAIDPKDITEQKLAVIFGGTRNLASKIWALRTAVVNSAELVHAAMDKVLDTNSDAAVAEFARVVGRHDMIQSILSSVTTEVGRGLGMGFRNLEGWQKASDLEQLLKDNTGRTLFQLKQIAKLGASLDSSVKISKFLRDAEKRSFGGMVLEYWINGLISGPATHVTYLIGNEILAFMKAVPETLIASGIGSAREAMGRPGERVRAGEAWVGARSMVADLPAAFHAALEAAHTGQATLLPGQKGRPLTPFQGDTALSVARSLTNDPVTWSEVGAQSFAIMRSIKDGLIAGASLLAAGGEKGAPLLGLHYSPGGQIPDIAFRGVRILPGLVPGGTMARLPSRSVAAIHSFFATSNYLREVAAEAYRTASGENLTGNAFAARIADIRQNPSQDVMDRAIKGAYASTLMSEGGAFVKALSQLTNAKTTLPLIGELRPLKFIDPFVHIGANVINQSIVQRTPLGILSSEVRADLMGRNGNIAQDQAQARMLAGTALSLAFGSLAMNGYASGSGPSDPHKSAMWRLAGNQAHSIRIGDIWYQVNRLGPMGMLMGVAADMYDVAHEAGQGDMLLAASHLQHAVTQNILDESFMRGPADLIKAVEDPGRYGESYLKQFASSFLPYSVGMAQMARATDPYARQARTVMDAIKSKVPGQSETLFPRRDIWGEEIPNPDALGMKGLTAIWEKHVGTDPVNLAMLSLGIAPAAVDRKIRNVDLTEQEYDDFARIAGRMAKMRLDTIVKSPDWETWPNHVKHAVISEVLKQSRTSADGLMMMRYPHIPQDAAAAIKKRFED